MERREVPDNLGVAETWATLFSDEARQRWPWLEKQGPVWAVVADVAEMARVNNEWGHTEGDRMLQTLANSLKAHFPGQPLLRPAGDTFAVLLPSSAPFADDELSALKQQLSGELEAWFRVGSGLRLAGIPLGTSERWQDSLTAALARSRGVRA